MKLSIDTISEISQHEASPVTTTSPRTAFERQLCTHLLSLSEVVETLADRLMELETRLAAVEGQQLEDAESAAVSDDAGDLLLASEEKVRMLRDLSLIHISEPTRLRCISYAVFCLKKKNA